MENHSLMFCFCFYLLQLAFRLLEQDGSYGPEFMKMEFGGHLLNRTDGKGVEIYVRLLDDLTASVIGRGTENTQTSGTKALKDVFFDVRKKIHKHKEQHTTVI